MVAAVRGGCSQGYMIVSYKGWVLNWKISRQNINPFYSPTKGANIMIKVYIFSSGIEYSVKLSNNVIFCILICNTLAI